MVVKHTPRHEVIDARVWDAAMSQWWSLAPWQEINLQWREDWGVDTGEIRLAEDHPRASRLRAARHIPVPVTFEVNGVRWDGYVESTETGQETDGTRYLRVTVQSETKHFHRMLGRGPVASAADGSSDIEEGSLGAVTHRLVARGAVRTGLPTYVLIDHQGDPVQIEVRTEDYVASLLEEPLAGSNSFVQVRKLLPGQAIPGTGRVLHYEGAMEREWAKAQLAKGLWPKATSNSRIYSSSVLTDTPPMPDNSWKGMGQIQDGALLSEPMEGICWIPFETVVERPLGYYMEIDPAEVHVIDRLRIKDGPGAQAGRPHFVTYWAGGKFKPTKALERAVSEGLVRGVDGWRFTSTSAVVTMIGNGVCYAWKEGVEWVVATAAQFRADSQRYAPSGAAQVQTPGVLVWQHAGRDRRGVVFSSAPGGGLKRWATTETAPDGAMLIGGGQLDAQTIAALESGLLKPQGTVASAAGDSAKALLPSSADMPGAVERLDVDVQPHATIDGTEVSFSKAGGRVNIEAAGPFFLREKYMNLSSTGGTDPTAEIAREWAASQGTTSMSLTPGHHQTVVFGDDVRRDDGRVVPGWKPGDRISFVDGTTRVSEVIMGYTLKASATEELTVEPILGRRDNGIMSDFKSMLSASEKAGRKALLSPPRKVPKNTLERVADARFGDTSMQWRQDIAGDLAKSWEYMNKASAFSEESQKYSAQSSEHSQASYRYSEKSREFSEASLAHSEKSLGYSKDAARHSEASLEASQQSSRFSQESQSFSQEAKGYSGDANDLSLKAKSYSEAAGASAEDAEKWRAQAEEARRLAENARSAAETARSQAEKDRDRAETARSAAESARSSAETARSRAESARSEAESARDKAESQRSLAEYQRERAEIARSNAERNRNDAVTYAIRASSSATAAASSASAAANSAAEKAEAARQISESNKRAIAMEALGQHGQWTVSYQMSIPENRWVPVPFHDQKGRAVGVSKGNYGDGSYHTLHQSGDWQIHCRFMFPPSKLLDFKAYNSLLVEVYDSSDNLVDAGLCEVFDEGYPVTAQVTLTTSTRWANNYVVAKVKSSVSKGTAPLSRTKVGEMYHELSVRRLSD